MLPTELTWSIGMLVAWMAGERFYRLGLPRIFTYSACGFLAGPILKLLHAEELGHGRMLADAAMGLLLFEIGYRFNPLWVIRNRWFLITSILESGLTFLSVLGCCLFFDLNWLESLTLASVSMATSPAVILRITRDAQSSGQVTNLTLSLSALNCLYSILAFNAVTGMGLQTDLSEATAAPGTILLMVSASVALACLSSGLFTVLLRITSPPNEAIPFSIALFVACVTMLADTLQLSPALATLVLGCAMRGMQVKITGRFQDFGSFGRFFTLFLFVYMSVELEWNAVKQGIPFACLVVLLRGVVKVSVCMLFADRLGTSRRKGALTGVALMPISAFALILMEQARATGVNLLGSFPPLVAIAFLLEFLGPLATRIAITQAAENND